MVDFALASNDLIVAAVFEAECVKTGLDIVLPDLFESSPDVRRRIPSLLAQVALRRSSVPRVGVAEHKSLLGKSVDWSRGSAVDMISLMVRSR